MLLLRWHIGYDVKEEEDDSGNLFEDVKAFLILYERPDTGGGTGNRARLIIDMGARWSQAIQDTHGDQLSPHDNQGQYQCLMQDLGDKAVAGQVGGQRKT
jgi:hypothetical protein